MKISVLHLGSPNGLYGAERWILALLKNLNPGMVNSIVAVIKDDPSLEPPLCIEAEKLGIQTKCFEAYGKVNLSSVRMLKNFILENRIQIVHTHFYKTDIIGLLAVRGSRCKIVTTPHGWSEKAGIKLWCYEQLDRAAFAFFDAVVPLSERIFIGLLRIPRLNQRLQLIRNGVDISEVNAVSKVADEMVRWKKNGHFVFGYIGQLIHRKGIDLLIQALTLLKDENWRLAVIGDGERRAELEELAKRVGVDRKVTFWGYREDRISFLKGFDAFVLPSRLEGIPRCVMEAMAAGIPVVVSDIPGCRDLVRHGKTGLLFEKEKVQDLADKLEMIISDAKLKVELACNAQYIILNEFSAYRMARKYEELYEKIAVSY